MKTELKPGDWMRRFAKRNLTRAEPAVWRLRSVGVLLLLTLLFANVAFTQSTTNPPNIGGLNTSCGLMIADHIAWLKANVVNGVDAYVATNESILGDADNVVTYAKISLKTVFNNLITNPTTGKEQYFSNRKWGEQCTDGDLDLCVSAEHPFSPFAKETISMTAYPNGSIYIKSNSGKTIHTFTPSSCLNGVIIGRVSRTGYLITLKKFAPIPPR